jgi:flagellar biosynthetic protein FliS
MNDPQIFEQAHRDYLESRILTAHPMEIVEMLYQVAIDSLHAAIGHLKSGDRFARAAAVTKAQEAVHELAVSLDHTVGASFTHTLAGLYQFVLQQITLGHARQSEREFQEAMAILTTLSGTWSEVKRQVCGEAQAAVEVEAPELETVPPSFHSPYGAPAFAELSSRDWNG